MITVHAEEKGTAKLLFGVYSITRVSMGAQDI